jgi:hypothetical protein
MIENYARR